MFLNADTIDFHSLKGIPVETFFSGLAAFGTTGSGKTRTVLRPLLRSLLSLRANEQEAKAGALIIDPKGSDLLPIIQDTLEQCGRQEDLVMVGPGNNEHPWNPLAGQLSAAKVASTILAASATLGQESSNHAKAGERFWEAQDRALLGALVALSRHTLAERVPSEELTFEHLQQCRRVLAQPEKRLREWATDMVTELGFAEGMPLLEMASLPESTRSCVIGSLGSLLQPYVCDPLRSVLQPHPGRSPADLRNIFEQGKVVILNTAHAEYALELLPAQVLIKSAFTRLALSRSRWAKNTSRPCWLFVDEGARCYTAQADSDASEANLMEMSRANRVGVIWATQNLSALLSLGNEHLPDKLAALAGTHVFLANTCPACASLAARSLGTERRYELHRTVENAVPPPLFFPSHQTLISPGSRGVLVPSEVPRLTASAMARLRPGEMWLRLAHTGEVHHIQADVAAP